MKTTESLVDGFALQIETAGEHGLVAAIALADGPVVADVVCASRRDMWFAVVELRAGARDVIAGRGGPPFSTRVIGALEETLRTRLDASAVGIIVRDGATGEHLMGVDVIDSVE